MAFLDLVYINDRVIAMGFPVDKRPPPPPAEGVVVPRGPVTVPVGNDIDMVAAVLRGKHAGHYMVWNVSEEGYDYSLFEDQVGWLVGLFVGLFVGWLVFW